MLCCKFVILEMMQVGNKKPLVEEEKLNISLEDSHRR